MSLYQPKGSPFWHYDFQIKGSRFHGSTETANFEEAKAVQANARVKAIADLKSPHQRDMSLNEAFGKFWEEHAKHKKSSEDIWRMLEVLKDGIGKDKMLSRISNRDIADFIGRRRGEMKKVKDGEKTKLVRARCDSSVNREVEQLRTVLNRAAKVWDVALKMPNWEAHGLMEPLGRTRSLTVAEETALFKALRADFHPLVRFCLITGARVSSARKLTWKDINLDDGEITLEVKSRFLKRMHTLPITPEIAALLAAVKGQHAIYVFTYVSAGKVVRKRLKGQRYPFARDGWRRTWAKALRDAGIEDFRFHDLRHTAATQMLRATKNLAAIKEILGHKDISTTMRYAHVLKDDLRDALSRKIPEAVAPVQAKPELKIVSSKT